MGRTKISGKEVSKMIRIFVRIIERRLIKINVLDDKATDELHRLFDMVIYKNLEFISSEVKEIIKQNEDRKGK